MRHALSQQFKLEPHQWSFLETPNSAPQVNNLPIGAHLSLSHSCGFISFAISFSPLGIDLENSARQRDFSALAEQFMSQQEIARFQHEDAPSDYFYRIWCAKEACYKALSPRQQSETGLRNISYAGLADHSRAWYLSESNIDGHNFAAVLKEKPRQVTYRHFCLSRLTCLDSSRQLCIRQAIL